MLQDGDKKSKFFKGAREENYFQHEF